jgi:hypothetical protein
MAETLHVKAVPGVLVRDPRVTSSHTFIGRTRMPTGGPGLALGHISSDLYDPGRLHRGEPVDVDEVFPIIEEGVELSFDTAHKHPGVKLESQHALAKVKALIKEGALELLDSTAAADAKPAVVAPATVDHALAEQPAHAEEHVK